MVRYGARRAGVRPHLRPGESVRRFALVLLLTSSAVACGDSDDDSSGVTPTPTEQTNPTATPTPCTADASWVENPMLRAEVPNNGGTSFCDFHRFAWEDFLALVEADQGALFETYMPKEGVFDPSSIDPDQGSEPFPYGTQLPVPNGCPIGESGRSLILNPFIGKGVPSLGGVVEAGSNAAPFADQNGNWLHYGIAFNEIAYDFLTQCQLYRTGCFNAGVRDENLRFPDQSIVLKTAWIVVNKETVDRSRFYVTAALVNPLGPTEAEQGCHEVTVALVGFHIMHKTPRHPEWIWATFEHEDTAPDCAKPEETPPGGSWLYFDPHCDGDACTENVYQNPCSSEACPASDSQSYTCGADLTAMCIDVATCDPTVSCRNCYDRTCTEAPIPSQICRNFPVGWTLHGTDATPTVDAQYSSMNESVRSILAENDSVWQHYNLIGTLWCTPPDTNAPGGMACSRSGPLATADQVGQLRLSNSGMESYNQRLNCFSCHNGAFAPTDDPFPQADFSHLFAGMVTAGDCDEDVAAFCPEGAPEISAVPK